MKNIARMAFLMLVLIFVFALSACSGTNTTSDTKSGEGSSTTPTANVNPTNSTPPTQTALDLTGKWKQTNANSNASYQRAVISKDSIEIYWVNESDDSEALYWAGTYVAPQGNEKQFSWDSVNDKDKTGFALMASPAETKTFSYNNGELSYSVSAMGMTQTVKLKKQ